MPDGTWVSSTPSSAIWTSAPVPDNSWTATQSLSVPYEDDDGTVMQFEDGATIEFSTENTGESATEWTYLLRAA